MNKNRTALVTGAARGIGRATSAALAQKGFNIVLADILPDADETEEQCHKYGAETLFIQTDVSSRADREHLLESIDETFGRIDLLVNNAGVSVKERKDILESTEESYDRVMAINLKGPLFLTQSIAKQMIRLREEDPQSTPMIINIASLASYASATSMPEYCLSKTGVSMMTKLYADRLAGNGINVYEIRPGIVKTDMTKVVREKYNTFINNGGLPIRRWGYPEDIAKAIAGITEGYFAYSTGQVIDVDGGFHLRRL